MSWRSGHRGGGLGIAAGDPADVWHRECRSRVPHRGGRGRRRATVCGRRCLQASLHRSATISSFCRRSIRSPSPIPTNVVGIRSFHAGRDPGLQCRGARAARRRCAAIGSGPHHGVALRLQPEARRRRHARRCLWATAYQIALMLKVRVRAAAAARRRDRGHGRLSAGRHARRGRPRRRELGLGATTAPPAAAPIRCPAPSACSCRCAPGAARSASSASTATGPGPLLTPDQRRLLDALSTRERSPSSVSTWSKTWIGSSARCETERLRGGAADLDLARSARRRLPRSWVRPAHCATSGSSATHEQGGSARHHHRGGRAAQSLHRQSARHDQAGIGRHRARMPAGMTSARSSAARCAGPARSSRDHRVELDLAPTCRCWNWTPCCSSRCCSTCWTMPPNIRLPVPRSRSGRARRRYRLAAGLGRRQRHSCRTIWSSIFDKFYRAQKGDQVRPGTGLGLAISPRLRRGDGRDHHRRQPHRPQRRGVHDHAPDAGRTADQLDTAA